ncbi:MULTISPECIES: hypothetical protein [Tatumella]|uniref:Uncharacterized protein n=1 Tax=Tatumella punctata TaxID=399969 RepID=A0ABW1VRN2_9GAMM|nr:MULTISPECIES: hypothetical protein [unclassified Tatumella]MBS0856288.1 hypothetical protein [Tatumella sp. JGM16]MBS0876363.1 hypothetical protein [Tatumella sp. JGM82]MBS0889536.1 hypothetical protein [Tatumella sp. JGM94]MBS0894344.1 hypothetical protein [Tatumella sp. JGM130]MBS0900658.1 hypothetical protein [Tatumella sp. JGM100]
MTKLTSEQKRYVDELAMMQIENMNSDEFLLNQLKKKIHGLEGELKEFFEERLAFHRKNHNK